jgi:hypothetical protein
VKQENLQEKLERMHEDLKSLIPAAKASAMLADGDEDETATSNHIDGANSTKIEIEYVGMDEGLMGGNGRVSDRC